MSYSRDFLLSLSQNTNPPSRQVKRRVFYLNIRSNIYNSNKLNKSINNYSKSFKNNCRLAKEKKKNLKKSGRKEGHPSRKTATKLMKVLFESDL